MGTNPKTKEEIKAEANHFAGRRDELFDKTAEKAAAAFQRVFDINAFMQHREIYLKLLFVKVGSDIVREMVPEAQRIGKDYAKGFQST